MVKHIPVVGLALAATLAAPAVAQTPMQPPMNSFNDAFYTCDNDASFQLSYDSETPKEATLTTKSNKRFDLKRTQTADGVQFSGGGATFWTDGKTLRIDGVDTALRNCKLKAS